MTTLRKASSTKTINLQTFFPNNQVGYSLHQKGLHKKYTIPHSITRANINVKCQRQDNEDGSVTWYHKIIN